MADLAVVGAGPAGLAAALSAARRGVDVTLIDSAPTLGGQIWRQPASGGRADDAPPLLRAVLAHPRVDVLSETSVVHAAAERGARLLLRSARGVWRLDASALVLAAGAAELSLPFPGWDLPGVVTPGAAQAMLKAHGVPIGRRVVVAGTGAFLWPVAAGLITAGVQVAAVVEASPLVRNTRSAAGLLRHRAIVTQATGYLRAVVRARVPLLSGRAVVAARGDGRVESVTVARLDGSGRPLAEGIREIAVDAACVGWGFVPAVELARTLSCAESAHPTRPYTTVAVDEDQATSVRGVFAAGELTGVGGAMVAEVEGEIAGAAAAAQLGATSTAGQHADVARARKGLRQARRAAAVLDRAYPIPQQWSEWLADETTVCRCEEVSWREVRDVVDAGIGTARGVKGQTRCGMGWCQGRMCGPALQSAIARRAGRSLADVGDLAGRPLAAPLTVGEIAEIAD